MSSRFPSTVITGLALCLCAGIVWFAARRTRGAEAAYEGALVRNSRAEAAYHLGESAVASAAKDLAHLRATSAAAVRAHLTAGHPTGWRMSRTIAERLRNDPATQLAYIAYCRAIAAQKYGALFRRLDLSPEQIGKFEDMCARYAEEVLDVGEAIAAKGISFNDPIAGKMMAEVLAEREKAESALLGPAGYAEAREFERTASVREMVGNYAGGAVLVAREPFTPEQGERLVSLIANSSESYREGGEADVSQIDWASVMKKARAILGDAQLALLATMEPPLPDGGRYQTQFYRVVNGAQKADASKATGSKAGPSRG